MPATPPVHVLAEVTARVTERSRPGRRRYLRRVRAAARVRRDGTGRAGFPEVAVVAVHSDLPPAHPSLPGFPALVRDTVRGGGGVARFAGAVPVLCGAVGAGGPDSELPLFARDVVATSTAAALVGGPFDGALLFGACGTTCAGLLLGALAAGHLPVVMVPAVPDACTAAGDPVWRQVVEVLGLHLPGAPAPSRAALAAAAGERLVRMCRPGPGRTAVGETVDERAVVDAAVALLAAGGSDAHARDLLAVAAAAGVELRAEDLDALAAVVPLVVRGAAARGEPGPAAQCPPLPGGPMAYAGGVGTTCPAAV